MSSPLDAAFDALCAEPDETLDLAFGALLLARFDHPDLSPDEWLARLDELASAAPPDAADDLSSLTGYLYGELGFRGNRLDYYDIRNSYLHQVLDRKLGIPISLATMMIEVAKRLGRPLQGVGFPGHFLVQAEPGELYLDPFDGGRRLDRSACVDLFRQTTQGKARFDDRFLDTVTPRQMLVRMLNNMLALSIRERLPERVLFCLDSIVDLVPDDPDARLQRGRYLYEAGDASRAIPDFEAFLRMRPHGGVRRGVEAALAEAHRRGSTLH